MTAASVAVLADYSRMERPADRFQPKGVVIQFPQSTDAVPFGIFELDCKGVVTAFSPAKGERRTVRRVNFFTSIAPYDELLPFGAKYEYYFSGELIPSVSVSVPGILFTFNCWMRDCVIVVVERDKLKKAQKGGD